MGTRLPCAGGAVAAALLGVAAVAQSEGAAALVGEVRACAAIAGADERLACYDALADAAVPMPSDGGQPASREDGAGAAGSARGAASREPGAPEARALDEQGLREPATFEVARITTGADERLRITAENGQVWSQIGLERVMLPRDDEIVAEVSAGALGSSFMRLNGGRPFRVRRVR